MRAATTVFRAVLLCGVLPAAILLGGCSTSTGPDPVITDDPDYHVRTTPEDVIHNIRTAYIWMNATEYLDCLSEDFTFYPTERDVQDPNMQIPPEWYKSDERSMHENMFAEGSNVESITLTLTIVSTEYEYGIPEDEFDDVCVCRVDVDLRVRIFGPLTYLVTSPAEFHMRPDVDQPGPGRTRLWEMHRWFDLGDQGRGGSDRVEDATWGGVKSLYR